MYNCLWNFFMILYRSCVFECHTVLILYQDQFTTILFYWQCPKRPFSSFGESCVKIFARNMQTLYMNAICVQKSCLETISSFPLEVLSDFLKLCVFHYCILKPMSRPVYFKHVVTVFDQKTFWSLRICQLLVC